MARGHFAHATILVGPGRRVIESPRVRCRNAALRYLRCMSDEVVVRCSRIECGEPAAAQFAFDAMASLVWLDPVDDIAVHAGYLCADHAEALTAPLHWTLQDRRARAPRLWADRPAGSTRPVSVPRTARRARKCAPSASALPELPPSLPFSLPANVEAVVDEDAPRWSMRNWPDPELDRLLDARTPLLARAFQAARLD